ncbi:MAG: glycosyltransferase [Lachnospiraceae bacterium]|nr:glycosyltransferase [Lachnospiraceae bacterium]MDE7201225.1 glycosyltransferase [Lachnospiraceae bacterium]
MLQLGYRIRKKRVLFVTTKNIDYIRNVQELNFLKQNAAWLKVIYSDKRSYIARIFEVWWKLMVSGRNFDVVFLGFAPQLAAPFFLKYKDKELIIDFFISVYDTLVNDRKIFSVYNPIAGICHWIDDYVIKKADYIITDTKADAQYFIREFHGDRNKFKTVYLEADKTIFYPRTQHKRIDLADKFVVLYFGSILPLQGVDVVLEAIELLKDEKDIFFQVIGPVSKKYRIPIQDNVEYIDWLGQEELAEYIANADLCLAGHFNSRIDKAKRTIPGKAYIYSAMGKKMVLGDNEANRELYGASDHVFWTEMGNAKALAKVILLQRCSQYQARNCQ